MKNPSLVEGFFMAKKWDEKDEFSFVTNLNEAGRSPPPQVGRYQPPIANHFCVYQTFIFISVKAVL
ncbi:hypothetical protein A2572_01220 [Candidatus Collierbacteria bacterium RIFOXYD1_FULL_40_9]|uniref:Uncharacterized protein n=1 Tax=Candidatus Collierbacteria bacterium RIFOXYD1_FULL_40_9 TaxID=1817731 RepID=A0A1F5FP58_9BACT|nr:MAG: hypothetical protein A2572_01220 [Candidatus Collierbacteria bacterium RIFOXYD1_FULL_40_9]